MMKAIIEFFPKGTNTRPKGGFALWIELSFEIDTFELTKRLIPQNDSIAPGRIFTTTENYNHCLCLSCAVDWNRQTEWALMKIVNEIKLMRNE